MGYNLSVLITSWVLSQAPVVGRSQFPKSYWTESLVPHCGFGVEVALSFFVHRPVHDTAQNMGVPIGEINREGRKGGWEGGGGGEEGREEMGGRENTRGQMHCL